MGGCGAQLGAARWIVGFVLLLAAGCGHDPLVHWDDGHRHRVHGFALPPPPSSDPPWHPIRVEGSDLAYQRGDGELMSLRASCKKPQAPPRIMAQHLRIGVGRHVVRSEGPVTHRGVLGWQQIFDVGDSAGAVRVQTVTLLDGPCTIDFLFSAREGYDDSAPDFDAWWQGFVPATPVAPGQGS
jgi:hypothetical protein